jgi:hypothetical protein
LVNLQNPRRRIVIGAALLGCGADSIQATSHAEAMMSNPLTRHLLFTDQGHVSLGDAARAFDRFVGSWDMDCVFTAADGTQTKIAGEWHFGWILGGRVVQDVLYFYPKGQRPASSADLRGGTTVRLYDPKAQAWLVSWFAALRGEVIHLQGGPQQGPAGERIVLHGLDVDGDALRWSFNDIEPTRFRWLGETSCDGGASWRVEQEMHLVRMAKVAQR